MTSSDADSRELNSANGITKDNPNSPFYRQDLQPLPETHYEEYDVIVVGAGPTGLFLALKIALKGINVLVLETGKAISESPRAAAYMPITIYEMQKIGIYDDLVSVGHLTTDGVVFRTPASKGNKVLAEMKHALIGKVDMRYPFNAIMVGQDVLAKIILKHAESLPNFHCKFSHTFAGLRQVEGQPIDVTAVAPNGERYFQARYVVGCDGAASAVRRSQSIPFEGFTWNDFRFVAINMRYDFAKYGGFGTGAMVVDEEDWAVIARVEKELIPGEGLWRVAFGVRASLSDDELKAQIPQKLERLLPGPRPLQYEIVAANPYWAHQRVARDYRVGNVILAGDAAHSNNPIGGLGLTTGILDAVALANCLIRILTKHEADPSALLDRYAEVRKKAFVDYTNKMSIDAKLRMHCQDREIVDKRNIFLKKLNEDEEFNKVLLQGMNAVMDDDSEIL